MIVYDYNITGIGGKNINMEKYKGKVLLVVNTASQCGFTPQYEGLEALHEKYSDKDFEIIGFPCNQFLEQEPESEEKIADFCKVNYGVTFQLSEKIDVKGPNVHPLFKYLSNASPFKGFDLTNEKAKGLQTFIEEDFPETLNGNEIKWNFTKFLINKEGNFINRFESYVEPVELETCIEEMLKE